MKFRISATFEYEVDEEYYADMTTKEAKEYEADIVRNMVTKGFPAKSDHVEVTVEII